jgi:hypothetical protein
MSAVLIANWRQKKDKKKPDVKIRLKNENTHKNYIFRGAITA